MTTPSPTGTVTSQHGAVYRADGTTQLTASSAAALVSTAPVNDPLLVVSETIFETRVPDGTVYPAQQKVLKFTAGQVIPTSAWNAAFAKATITSIVPATGAHGSTTPVTVTGTRFTPGSTMTLHVGGTVVTGITVISPVKLTCTVPTASAAGAADVTITNDGGTFDAGNLFTYT